jgi:feruloyl esterase
MSVRSKAILPAVVFAFAAPALLSHALHAQSCQGLNGLSKPKSMVTASAVAAGAFKIPDSEKTLSTLPAFCRVSLQLMPTADSDIHAEVWLPTKGWNGKFMAVGSGGWGGSIAWAAMADALQRGYATSATDDGHTGSSASFIVGHPEKFIDFAYRSEHEMTVESKVLIKAFYGREPSHSYWNGCSGGGREGLLQASRYPDEFDGVIAGDPANVRRNAWALWLANETFKDSEAHIPPRKYAMIHQFVLNACDAKDGVKDGLIENPEACNVDFKQLTCKLGDGPDCLTPQQVHTAQTLISPATDASGKIYFPRLEPGTEMRWDRLAGGPAPADLFLDQFRYVVYPDSDWDWRTFDLAGDATKANAIDKDVDDLQPDLSAFAKRGGKLLIYHGWADQQVAPGSSIDFYKETIKISPTPGWAELYMLPGMAHCSGGEGPDTFDKIGTLEQWVEHGKTPAEIIASHKTSGKVDRTRPICPYPQTAHYSGKGSIDDAQNFACSSPH